MEKLILLRLHDKKKSRLIFWGLFLIQISMNYWLYRYDLCLSNLPDLLYVPVTIASFIFPLPAAISQGLMAGGLLSLAYKLSVGGGYKDVLWFAFQQTFSFASAAAIIGVLRNKLESFYLRKEEMFFIDEFTGLPNMSAFNRDLLKIKKTKILERYKIVLVEIANQNEISAAFGQQILFKMQSVLQKSTQQLLGDRIKVYQIQLNTLLVIVPLENDVVELNANGDPKQIINVSM